MMDQGAAVNDEDLIPKTVPELIDAMGPSLYEHAIDFIRELGDEMTKVTGIGTEAGDKRRHTYAERLVLITVVTHGPCSMSFISDRIGLSRAAMTAAADRLEGHGWVVRVIDSEDRRKTLLDATLQGRQIYQAARKSA